MKAKKYSGIIAAVVLLVGIGAFFLWNGSSQEEGVIGGDRDTNGCLVSAGYAYVETIGACARSFELTPETEEAARVAVQQVGKEYALTVTTIETEEATETYRVTLEHGTERTVEVVSVQDGKIVPAPQALESGVELGTDGIVQTVDLTGAALDAPALITFKTDGNSVYIIAVPTMGLPLCVASSSVADVFDIVPGDKVSIRGMTDAEGRIVPCESETHQLKVSGIYKNEEVGLSFEYRKSPDGYLLKTDEQFSTDPSFVSGASLINKKEAAALLASESPLEFPPAIKLRVYQNPEKLSPIEWNKTNASETNYELALDEPVEIAVGRADAVGFTADGLYATDTYVATYGEYALVVTGEYIDSESDIFNDLEQLVATISLTQ